MQRIKESQMNIDDTYLRRYVTNLCLQVRQRQSPNLYFLFRREGCSGQYSYRWDTTSHLSDEAHEVQRFRQLQAKHLEMIMRLSLHVEMRDPFAEGHTHRLSGYAVAIAKELYWRQDKIEELEIGAHLHDIGKICIAESVLKKTDKLSSQELRQIRRHSRIGAGMLMKIDFLRPIVPYVLYHHERYDGKGYPFRLSGKDIPVEGRIMAVVDTFDALVNSRPYRKAMSPEMAIDELITQKEHQLDPDVIDIFIDVLRKKEIRAS